jgi:hypothetical protein
MARPTNEKPRVPLGPALDWSDEELDQLAHISAADVRAAVALWRNEAPPETKLLLDAQEVDSEKQ